MTIDLWYLAATVAMAWLLIMVAATPGILRNGLGWALGSREVTPEATGFEGRSKRLAANMSENLPLFASLVLVAHVSGSAGSQSALGVQIFFFARVAHALCYLIGIPGLRTASWAVSVAGMAVIGASLFG